MRWQQTPQEMVREFHEAFGCAIGEKPALPDHWTQVLRADLLVEEVDEFVGALAHSSLVRAADALADIVYVAYGAAITFGVDLDAVLKEVHRSNMAKLVDGKVLRREDGKILKPEGWQPPDIAGVLGLS